MKLNKLINLLALMALMFHVEAMASDLEGTWTLVSEQRGAIKIDRYALQCSIDTTQKTIEFKFAELESSKKLGYSLESEESPWHMSLENGNQLVLLQEGESQLRMYSVVSKELSMEKLPDELEEGWILRTFSRANKENSQDSAVKTNNRQGEGDSAIGLVVERPPKPKPRLTEKRKTAMGNEAVIPVDSKYLSLWKRTSPVAATEFAMEARVRKKLLGLKQGLDLLEIKRILALDFERMQEHVLVLEKAVCELQECLPQRNERLRQFVEQELLLIRNMCSDAALVARANAASKSAESLFDCEFAANKEFSHLHGMATKTFEKGVPILINYTGPSPIALDDSIGILNLELPLNYLRNPELPPGGCRVVVKLAIKKGDKSILLSHATDYQPCVFEAGNLAAEFCALGDIPIAKDSVLFVYVTSLNETERGEVVPFSNILTIPVSPTPENATDVSVPNPLVEAQK